MEAKAEPKMLSIYALSHLFLTATLSGKNHLGVQRKCKTTNEKSICETQEQSWRTHSISHHLLPSSCRSDSITPSTLSAPRSEGACVHALPAAGGRHGQAQGRGGVDGGQCSRQL